MLTTNDLVALIGAYFIARFVYEFLSSLTFYLLFPPQPTTLRRIGTLGVSANVLHRSIARGNINIFGNCNESEEGQNEF